MKYSIKKEKEKNLMINNRLYLKPNQAYRGESQIAISYELEKILE
jgi:hypothetical protein